MIYTFLTARCKNMKKLKPLAASEGLIVRVVLRIHMPRGYKQHYYRKLQAVQLTEIVIYQSARRKKINNQKNRLLLWKCLISLCVIARQLFKIIILNGSFHFLSTLCHLKNWCLLRFAITRSCALGIKVLLLNLNEMPFIMFFKNIFKKLHWYVCLSYP